jgi:cytochrome c biogenesis factor
MPYVIMVAMLTTTFLAGVVVFITNPFQRVWHVPGADQLTFTVFAPAGALPYLPEDGQGLNPLLRHFGMIGHPPTTYIYSPGANRQLRSWAGLYCGPLVSPWRRPPHGDICTACILLRFSGSGWSLSCSCRLPSSLSKASRRARKENFPAAFLKLVSRNRRRYGGYIIHLGVVMIALGVIGDAAFKQETQGTLSPGEELKVGVYSFRYEGLRAYPGTDGREVVQAEAALFKDGEYIRQLQPRRDNFVVQEQPITIPGVHSAPGEDVYTLLLDWQGNGSSATFKVYVNPLINWIWTGGLTMILGTLVAALSSFRKPRPGILPAEGLPAQHAIQSRRLVGWTSAHYYYFYPSWRRSFLRYSCIPTLAPRLTGLKNRRW